MTGFRNPIIGAAGVLLRAAIRSPNYVPGLAGWSINRNGSVDFNVGNFRGTITISGAGVALLVYDGTPQAHSLILAISSVAGVDAYGNPYAAGLTLQTYTNQSGTHLAPVTWYDQNRNVSNTLTGGDTGMVTTVSQLWAVLVQNNTNTQLAVNQNEVDVIGLPFYVKPILGNSLIAFGVAGNGDMYLGAGPGGKYYARTATFSVSIPASVVTTITATTNMASASDYGSCFTAGVFTAPVAAFYDVYLHVNGVVGSTNTQASIRVNGAVVGQNQTATSNVDVTVSALWYLAAGDTVSFTIFHNASTAQTVNGHHALSRRL
jgi:hypothetical protein